MVVIFSRTPVPEVTVEIETDPVEIERSRAQQAQADANWDWLRSRLVELAVGNRGRYLCVAGQQAFIADTPVEARRLAREAHPDDKGIVSHYFRTSTLPLI
jgi:hypothetical protein